MILTRKLGESYPAEASKGTFESLGVKLHQADLDGFQVAGFEIKEHLGFFVSALEAQENLQIASKLAPTLARVSRQTRSSERIYTTEGHGSVGSCPLT
ncbi:MAG: hypothetical protein L0312_18650, partial [Acidobacteria bacterium]|nr:hypothetical protein [Acidobacteriota bacterium]